MTNADEQSEHNHTGVKLEIATTSTQRHKSTVSLCFSTKQRQNTNEENLLHCDLFMTEF